MKKSKPVSLVVLALAVTVMYCPRLLADPVTIDEVVYQSWAGLDPNQLSGTADFSLAGNTLTIVLTNTSGDTGGADATKLLAGIGFNLPNGVTISAGSATYATSATLLNFTASGSSSTGTSGDVNAEWGWDGNNTPFAVGSYLLLGSVNASVSTLQSSHTTRFDGGSGSIDGPSYGLLSANQASFGNGSQAIVDQITIALTLDLGTFNGDLVEFIDEHQVALAFGSPNGSRVDVPEPLTLIFLGTGLLGLGLLRRKSS